MSPTSPCRAGRCATSGRWSPGWRGRATSPRSAGSATSRRTRSAGWSGRPTRWRGSPTERGFSMALGRVGGPGDDRCVVATATENGVAAGPAALRALGSGRPLARPDAPRPVSARPGLNDFLIVETIKAAPGLGVKRISLNFAVFRAALERGERIGAGPVLRAWRRVLLFASRWFQIESLYKFNAKFQPALGAPVPGLPQHPGPAADRPGRAGGRGVPGLADRRAAPDRAADEPGPVRHRLRRPDRATHGSAGWLVAWRTMVAESAARRDGRPPAGAGPARPAAAPGAAW